MARTNDDSCIRLRPEHPNHVWSYDFVHDRTHDGKALRFLCLIDEYTRECKTLLVERSLSAMNVIDTLGEAFVEYGAPEYIRSDNGPEFVAKAVRHWLARIPVKTL